MILFNGGQNQQGILEPHFAANEPVFVYLANGYKLTCFGKPHANASIEHGEQLWLAE